MAARRRSAGSRSKGTPRWLMLLLGLGIGIAGVYLYQMLRERGVSLSSVTKVFSSGEKKTEEKKPDAEAKPAKPKFDFYTILPETETVLPEKTPAKPKSKPELKPETAKTTPEPGVSYMLQAASFATFAEADQLKARLTLSGLAAQIQKVSIEGRGDYYRVRLGPFSKIEELDAATQQLQQAGLKPIRLKVKKEGA